MNRRQASSRGRDGPKGRRPIARSVLIAAVLVLGVAAAARLPIAFLPAWSLPELRVDLALPEATDLGDLTRRWILPLESSIRAAGGVRGLAGEVNASGGNFRVRFRAGTDAERKAARLESELAGLRRRLPPGARLEVWPVGQGAGDESAVVWLGPNPSEASRTDSEPGGAGPGSRAESSRAWGGYVVQSSLIESLRDLPKVRSVVVAGEARREIRVRARQETNASAGALDAAIDAGLQVRRLGETRLGGLRLPVVVAGNRHLPFHDLPVRQGAALVPLRAVAEIGLRHEAPRWSARLGGTRGLGLLISRGAEASPLALDRSLREAFAASRLAERTRSLIDEAAPLRQLLARLLWGLVAATLLLVAACGQLFGAGAARWQAVALPAALAAALNAVWLARLPLDVTTLPAIAAGLGCALLATAFRAGKGAAPASGVGSLVASVLILPVAVGLAGGTLAPLLAAPVRAFVVAAVAGLAALWLLPRLGLLEGPAERLERLPPRWLTGPLKWTQRNPWTVLLGTAVTVYMLLVLAGSGLEPRTGDLEPAIGDLAVSLRFTEGGTVDQAAAQIAAVERHLDQTEEVTGHWSMFNRWRGTVVAEVRRRDRPLNRLATFARRLQAELGSAGASARVTPLGGRSGGDSLARLSESLEDRPETDDDVTFYRFILRHTDAGALQLAHAAVMDRLASLKYAIWYDQIHADWAQPSTRVELVPRPGVSPEQLAVAARAVAAGGSMPGGRPLAAERDLTLRVMDPRSPRRAGEVKQRAELLGLQAVVPGSPIVPAAFLEAREVIASPTVKRQSGRFALPMTLNIAGSIKAVRKNRRGRVDMVLGNLRLPAGTTLERPELNPAIWTRERLTLLKIAAALPALLFALAVCRLNSFSAALASLVPPLLGVAVAAPWIRTTLGHLDEMTLLLLAAAIAGSFAVTLEAAAVAGPAATGAAYRWLARRALGFAVVVPALLALLVVPGLGLDNDRHPWVLPLRVAGVAASVVCLTSFLVLPVLLRTALRYVGPLPGRRVRRRAPGGRSRQGQRPGAAG